MDDSKFNLSIVGEMIASLMIEPHQRNLANSRVHACGNFAQRRPDPGVGGVAIDLESFGAELARQRHVKARAQIADEALDLALGPEGDLDVR